MKLKFLTLIALLAGMNAAMAEGEFEIDQSCVAVGCFPGDSAGFPVSLQSGGQYRLTSNLTVSAGAVGISIQTSQRVVIDLGGYEITGSGVATHGISIDTGTKRVRIHNGVISGMTVVGINLPSVLPASEIDNVVVQNNSRGMTIGGFDFKTVVRIRRLTCTFNAAGCGITPGMVGRLFVSESEISDNDGVGMLLPNGSVVTDSVFSNNSGFALDCEGATNRCALGRNYFHENNGNSISQQFGNFALRDLGHNACDDGSCP